MYQKHSSSSSNFNIGKLLRLREEIMTPINTIMDVLTTTADIGSNILGPIKKKGLFYRSSCSTVIMNKWHAISTLNYGKFVLDFGFITFPLLQNQAFWWFYSSLESNQLEDVELAFLESFDTQQKLQPGVFPSSIN